MPDQTVKDLVKGVWARLATAEVPNPLVDACALVSFASDLTAADVRTAMARGDAVPPSLDAEALEAAVARREAREPLQHILGYAPFRTLELTVGTGVFIPRYETEIVAGVAIDAAREVQRAGRAPRVADLCAGSGAIGLSVAVEVPEARVTLVELDAAAFGYLERNAAAQEIAVRTRIDAIRGDARTALASDAGGFDVVAANPPYIPGNARPRDPEVAAHDPAVALYGLGTDGLEVPRGVIANAARLLRPGGVFVMEHGAPQAQAVRDAVEATGAFTDVTTGQDLNEWDRFVRAVRSPAPG